MLAVLPFVTWDWMQATFWPVSLDWSVSVAMAAISGIWNAIAGTKLAYCAGMACVPLAEKLPSGTIDQVSLSFHQGHAGLEVKGA